MCRRLAEFRWPSFGIPVLQTPAKYTKRAAPMARVVYKRRRIWHAGLSAAQVKEEKTRMRVRLMTLALLTALMGLFVVSPMSAAAAPPSIGSLPAPDPGTLPCGGAFAGTLTITQFAVQNGQLVALGTLSGTLTDALGNVIGTVTNVPVTVPVTVTGTCQILHLELGPLDLNLLGLMVHLNQVVLDITAQSGPGNLLGNLLCAVAHLLDDNAATTALANLLNQIPGILSL
jgi:hypothetical protein